MKHKLSPPDHMDRWTRNERLYRHLRDQGLFVVPVYSEGQYPGIEYLQVATSIPESGLLPIPAQQRTKKANRLIAFPHVVQPMKGLKIP
jgi:hypothetical protein